MKYGFLWMGWLSVCNCLVAAQTAVPPHDGLKVWLDASDQASLEIKEGVITQWRDISGSDNHAVALGKPQVVAGQFNGKAVVRFAGSDGFNVPPIAKKSGSLTVFVVSRRLPEQAGGGGWQRLISLRVGDAADNKPPYFCLTTEAKSDPYPATVKVSSKDGVAPGPIGIGITAGTTPKGKAYQGDIAEVLIYDRGFLSEGALMEVLGYLCNKWNAQTDRKNSGWNRTGPLGETPQRITDTLPLADQQNRAGWTQFEPFSDEFNSGVFDTNKWMTFYRWKGRAPGLFRASNVTVTNGCMVLAMRREEVPEMKKDPKYHTYTSAYACTRQLSRYGYYEVRAKPMNSAGSSSFWFSQGVKQWSTEIDVFEIGGKAIGREKAYNMNAHVFRENGTNDHWNTGGVWEAPWRLADDFHVYGLAWTPKVLVYHVDGVAVRSMPNTHWNKPMRLIFDSETMPDWFGLPKDEDLPSFFQVDYVRVWKQPGWDGIITEEEAETRDWGK